LSRTLRFDPEWRLTLFTLVLVPVMVGLGFWQLQRAEEKTRLAIGWEQRRQQAPAPLSELRDTAPDALAYRRVQLLGEFAEGRYFLVDNKTRQGRFGYEVVALFEQDSGGLVLVNRGWIAGDPARRSLPQVPPIAGQQEVSGHVYVAPGKPYLLGEQVLADSWPKRVQAIEIDKLGPVLGEPLFPFTVRVDRNQPGALDAEWLIVNVSPEKHQAYAVQWFAMAAVMAGFYLLRSTNIWQLLTGRSEEED
jgi:cytochrome oxidase assembly protein ShyY1